MLLSKTKVLVTGGALRIGKAITEAFADAGATVRIHCNNSTIEAANLCESLSFSGLCNHEFLQCDFRIADRELLRSIINGCDILVNNASIYYPADSSCAGADSHMQYKINFEIPAILMKLFAEENKKGCIINILDAAVLVKDTGEENDYSRSKYDLKKATLENALVFAPEIRVNGVAPGAILPPDWLPESEMKKSITAMPLKKAPTVQNVADACVFLASNDGITGEIIKVDGGACIAVMHNKLNAIKS
jgi:pteridine reductase